MSVRTNAKKRSGQKANWPLRLLLVAGALYLLFHVAQTMADMEHKKQEWLDLSNSINYQIRINEDLEEQVANSDDELEHQANEEGLYQSGQQIYQGSAG